MNETPIIDSERVRLRPLVVDDAEALFSVYGDPTAMMWWTHAAHESVEQTREQLARNDLARDWRSWAITRHGDDRAIGTAAAHEERQGRVIEIGYSLAPAYWGTGLAREAVTALIDYLFTVEGHRRIFADTDPDNSASNGLLTRLGFTLEGRLRGEWETHIGVRDSLIWGLLRDEWSSRV
ncbi:MULTISPECIES: GNAT family N-acetyltransferase [unclassified Sphingomonas]|uniref:GNAT family N-acetyltransferase n=1 Tax=unclassified Sphingomonas TaxID=196159 RepID=UPI000BD8B8CB|nr:MAG: GNAT family N-acetyltransferase [Sphingomonas sp. 12-62-6]OYX40014.1 MAG: GNAT family N-acetyltransferase [Sphingomonas sp. 32-62-10]OYY66342.1 MAG: GNAT family N-acetyltransferase [Sphingomonas sp. 28-62-11]